MHDELARLRAERIVGAADTLHGLVDEKSPSDIDPRPFHVREQSDLHRANACIEMPAKYFVRAVHLAGAVTYDRDSRYWRRSKDHPAIRTLCTWWNRNAPQQDTRCAEYVRPWVRVRDDGEYRCACYDVPSAPMRSFTSLANANARVGEFVLLEFMKRPMEHSRGLQTYLVTGAEYELVGFCSEDEAEDRDEAWYPLEALARLPACFPTAWRALRSAGGART